jgi:hypothetical protein
LLATDINIRWLALKTALITCYNQSQAGQPFLISSAYYTLLFTWEQPHNYITFFFSSLAIRFGTVALLIRRLITPALNTAYVGNICFNCRKLDYCLLDCLLPCAFYAELKELKKLLEFNLKDNKHLTDKTKKDMF